MKDTTPGYFEDHIDSDFCRMPWSVRVHCLIEICILLQPLWLLSECMIYYMGVSKNRGTPKWMVDNGKPY